MEVAVTVVQVVLTMARVVEQVEQQQITPEATTVAVEQEEAIAMAEQEAQGLF
jgi:hypothetical protein